MAVPSAVVIPWRRGVVEIFVAVHSAVVIPGKRGCGGDVLFVAVHSAFMFSLAINQLWISLLFIVYHKKKKKLL